MRSTCIVLLIAALCGVACERRPSGAGDAAFAPVAADDAILIGAVVSLTGAEASFGISTRNGIELAIGEVNAHGGVKGRKVAVRVYDDESDPEEAAAATRRLIEQDGVKLLLGDVVSTNSIAMAAVAQTLRTPMITPSSTSPRVTAGRDYVSRVCFSDPFQGYVMAKYARDHLKVGRAGILEDPYSDYSRGLAEVFARKFVEMGGTLVKTETYEKGDTDFRAQLAALRNAKPEVVYVPGYYTDVAMIARQARDVGLLVPLLGGDGWDSERLHELGGDAIEGNYFSTHYSPEDPSPRTQRFIAEYKARFGHVPDALAALGYDAAKVALEAMKRADTLERSAIRAAIAQTRDFGGATGNISLDEGRNAVKPAVIVQLSEGRSRYVTTVAPP